MKKLNLLILYSFIVFSLCYAENLNSRIFIRVNQVGYLPAEQKIAIVFSNEDLEKYKFEIVDLENGSKVLRNKELGKNLGGFGNFENHYPVNFTEFKKSGRYKIKISGTNFESLPFSIGEDIYNKYPDLILHYIRQQRCGYNPFLDEVCHKRDGRTMYGPMPDSTYIDVSGGWHDAGDYLRYLLTSGNTVCRLLFTYRENKGKFSDKYNALGQPFPNDIPDILDEAKWGLDWMFKMHPESDQLFHQVADDRDHIGFKLPYEDTADYGWGPGSYRVVYYATGEPQGLYEYKSTSTGVANIAGRYAAAMAMAYEVWKSDLNDPIYAEKCLKAAKEVYEMGLLKPGCQEGTPCLAPYRYYENTWADDMEWGAAELYRVTGEERYLDDAKKFAETIGTNSWMGLDTAKHYEYYPFTNIGHYALFDLVDEDFQKVLIGYYKDGIEKIKERAEQNPYRIGIPFIWCSNNLAAAFVTQCILYEKMSGDKQYNSLMQSHRDWLLGKNPWGVTQFIGIPESGGVTPQHPHSAIPDATGRQIIGGMNDGPIYTSIYNQLIGIHLTKEDELAEFQSGYIVYHDDIGDYSTNEPTLDGTAEAAYFFSCFSLMKQE